MNVKIVKSFIIFLAAKPSAPPLELYLLPQVAKLGLHRVDFLQAFPSKASMVANIDQGLTS